MIRKNHRRYDYNNNHLQRILFKGVCVVTPPPPTKSYHNKMTQILACGTNLSQRQDNKCSKNSKDRLRLVFRKIHLLTHFCEERPNEVVSFAVKNLLLIPRKGSVGNFVTLRSNYTVQSNSLQKFSCKVCFFFHWCERLSEAYLCISKPIMEINVRVASTKMSLI